MFFDPQKYDLSKVGRHKMNAKLGLDTDLDLRTLRTEDFVQTVHYLLRLKKYDTTRSDRADEVAPVRKDDIDHLGNRRVRSPWANCWRTASAWASSACSAPSRRSSPWRRIPTAPCSPTT